MHSATPSWLCAGILSLWEVSAAVAADGIHKSGQQLQRNSPNHPGIARTWNSDRSLADSQALAATMKARAWTRRSSRVAFSMLRYGCNLPSFIISLPAMAPVISVKRPFSAGGLITWLDLKLDA